MESKRPEKINGVAKKVSLVFNISIALLGILLLVISVVLQLQVVEIMKAYQILVLTLTPLFGILSASVGISSAIKKIGGKNEN